MTKSEFEKLMDDMDAQQTLFGDMFYFPHNAKEFENLTGLELSRGCRVVEICFEWDEDEEKAETKVVEFFEGYIEGNHIGIEYDVAMDFLQGNL